MRHERPEAQPPAFVIVERDELATGLRMQRTVHQHKLTVDAGLQWQPAQKSDRIGGEPRTCPGDRPCGNLAKPVGGNLTGYGSIVIAGDTQRIEFSQQRNTFARVCIVADDVAETYDAIDTLHRNPVQAGLQCFQVGMNIREDGALHGPTPKPGCVECGANVVTLRLEKNRDIAPRTSVTGSSHAMPDFASQRSTQESQLTRGMPQALAAGRSSQIRHQRTPARACAGAPRGNPVKSA